jgi:hypothetical protein
LCALNMAMPRWDGVTSGSKTALCNLRSSAIGYCMLWYVVYACDPANAIEYFGLSLCGALLPDIGLACQLNSTKHTLLPADVPAGAVTPHLPWHSHWRHKQASSKRGCHHLQMGSELGLEDARTGLYVICELLNMLLCYSSCRQSSMHLQGSRGICC